LDNDKGAVCATMEHSGWLIQAGQRG